MHSSCANLVCIAMYFFLQRKIPQFVKEQKFLLKKESKNRLLKILNYPNSFLFYFWRLQSSSNILNKENEEIWRIQSCISILQETKHKHNICWSINTIYWSHTKNNCHWTEWGEAVTIVRGGKRKPMPRLFASLFYCSKTLFKHCILSVHGNLP